MKRWVYHSMVMRDLSIAESKMNAEGEKGWELVSVCLLADGNSARVFFRKPVEEELLTRDQLTDEAVVVGSAF